MGNIEIKILQPVKEKRNYFLLECKYHTKNWLPKNLISTKMKKTKVIMNKPVYGFDIWVFTTII